jgi:DNA invertase Pin-like site-specific DNA recombinase
MPDSPRTFVAYLRVSTDRQGKSGLGLEAQHTVINAYLRPGDRLIHPPFIEVESGRNNARPMLAEALAKCRKTGATLLVAKLDRLARNARFLLSVVEGSGEGGVVFCDLPTVPAGPVGKFLLTQMAAVAELEAGLISQRTKSALAAAKARGQKLGGDRGYRGGWAEGIQQAATEAAADVRKQSADHAAHRTAGAIQAARAELGEGASLHAIAAHLTAKGIVTPRGNGAWTATGVRRALVRLAA